MIAILRYALLIPVFILLASCGGGGGGGGDAPAQPAATNSATNTSSNTDTSEDEESPAFSVIASFMKGPVEGGTCKLFTVLDDGSIGSFITEAITRGNGRATLVNEIAYTGDTYVECIDGTYTDEASGESLTAPLMRTVMSLDGKDAEITLTPLTEIAYQLAFETGDVRTVLSEYNQLVADAFGFDGDIARTVPIDLRNEEAADDPGSRYAVLLALLSQFDADSNRSMSAIIDDLSDELIESAEFSESSLARLQNASEDVQESFVGNNVPVKVLQEASVAIGIEGPDGIPPDGYYFSVITPFVSNENPELRLRIAGAEVGATVNIALQVDLEVVSDSLPAEEENFGIIFPDISNLPDGVIEVRLWLEDEVGNAGEVLIDGLGKGDAAVELTGNLSYERVPFRATPERGLDFRNTMKMPARNIVVEARNQDGKLLGRTASDLEGNYEIHVAPDSQVTVHMQSQTVSTAKNSWNVQVVDNTDNQSIYELASELVNVGVDGTTIDLYAVAGREGSRYTDARTSGPFAILDTILLAKHTFIAVDPEIRYPNLVVNWSDRNSTVDGDDELGEIESAKFLSSEGIYLRGKEDDDTDEFDQSLVLHEWGHYFFDKLSRSDTFGGAHSLSDRLDPRTAYEEGFATVLAAIILDDPIYSDSYDENEATAYIINTEENIFDVSGWYSEASMISLLYDIYDDNDGGEDPVAVGLDVIYETLTGPGYTENIYLATVFSFVNQLSQNIDDPEVNRQIRELMALQGITGEGDQGLGETDDGGIDGALPLYREIEVDGDPVKFCLSDDEGEVNKLDSRYLVQVPILAEGSYVLTMSRASGDSDTDPDFRILDRGEFITGGFDTESNVEELVTVLVERIYIVDLYDQRNADDDDEVSGDACFEFRVARDS